MRGPRVSVLMLAYNHEAYLEQAVQSVIVQDTDFKFEVLIGVDKSEDRTLGIATELADANPDRIRVLGSERRIGMHQNFERLWKAARAPLIAFCESDDYWTREDKLMLQVAILDEHPECSFCGAVTEVIRFAEGVWQPAATVQPRVMKKLYGLEDLISAYNFHFSSVVVRKSAVRFPDWFQDGYCVDRPLYLLAAQCGPAIMVPAVLSTYRQHSGGAWAPQAQRLKSRQSLKLFRMMQVHFGERYQPLFQQTLSGILWGYVGEALASGDVKEARWVFWYALRHGAIRGRSGGLTHIAKVFGRTHLGLIYRVLARSST